MRTRLAPALLPLGEFWDLLESAARPDRDATADCLHDLLAGAGLARTRAFLARLDQEADSLLHWDLWGVGELLAPGMSVAEFASFRRVIVCAGPARLALARIDAQACALGMLDWSRPDLFADVCTDAALDALESLGASVPDLVPPTLPEGVGWDRTELPALFPRLADELDRRARR